MSCLLFVPHQKKAKGEELFEQIMYHLDIVEKDYFGLRFMDSAQVPVRAVSVWSDFLIFAQILRHRCVVKHNTCGLSLSVKGSKRFIKGDLSTSGVTLFCSTNGLKSVTRFLHRNCEATDRAVEGRMNTGEGWRAYLS